jgi:LL-diaminopimelate aminotransferase
LLPENGYLPRLDMIPPGIASRAKILWLNYPNNPTAAVAPLDFFAQAVEFARRYDILICHDAAYSQITFDGYTAPSLLQIPQAMEISIEFNTLSKSHNMAGWRVGAAVGNAIALRSLHKIKTNADSGHFLPILEAATAAMSGDQSWLAERNLVYSRRRDVVLEGLQQLDLAAETPRASLYVWAAVPGGWSSLDFCSAVLEKTRVSLTPGTVFGAHGEGYFRISLTTSEGRIAEAFQRIAGSGLASPREMVNLSRTQS